MTTTTTTTNQNWMQFYQQQPLMDGAIIPLPPKEKGVSSATTTHLIPPKVNNNTTNNVSKPIRRRSRASKRTPTTLLNANTTNFRALVQQFTGCPSTTMSSLGVHKGPITLNFKHGSSRQHIGFRSDHNNLVHQAASASAAAAPQFSLPVQQVLPYQQQLFQEQQGGYSFDYMKSNNFVPSLGNYYSRPSMEVFDGMVMGNDFNLHDLSVNVFSNNSY